VKWIVHTSPLVRHSSENMEKAPLSPSPATSTLFLRLAASALNIKDASRAFTSEGAKITAENYEEFVGRVPMFGKIDTKVYISEGEDFIGDVRVCIVFLCTDGQGYNTDSDYTTEIRNNLEILSVNVFTKFLYDVIIFYSWRDPITTERNKNNLISSFPYLNIRFANVSRHFPPHLPQHLIDNNVDMSLFEKGTDCAPGNHWALNYLHMGRFWSVCLWGEPILQDYDLIWRLDADATIDEPIKQNFLRDMRGKHKKFAYLCRTGDPPECASGIYAATKNFSKKKGIPFQHESLVEEANTYWGGFGIYATEFFCKNENWLDYVKYLDSLGGFYNHRWGEQNVFPTSLSLFLRFKELYWVRDHQIMVYHDHAKHPSCSGVDAWHEEILLNN